MMDIELRFNKNDVEAKQWIMQHFDVSEEDFVEIRSFNGEAVILAIFIAVTELIKNPEIINCFLNRPERKVVFDEHGQLREATNIEHHELMEILHQKKTDDISREQ